MQSLEEASNTIVTGEKNRQQVLIEHRSGRRISNALFATHVVPAFPRASGGPQRRFRVSRSGLYGERLRISKTEVCKP